MFSVEHFSLSFIGVETLKYICKLYKICGESLGFNNLGVDVNPLIIFKL